MTSEIWYSWFCFNTNIITYGIKYDKLIIKTILTIL